jgi:hypothetical protein
MSISRHPVWSDFARSFNKIAAHRHRYEVFWDFVTMAAISMHNAIRKDPALEAEYMQIVKRYDASQLSEICGLFAKLVLLLDTEPQDVLGQLYMTLELGNAQAGQFFTPPEISELMARMTYGDELQNLTKPFITLSEPACGAGGMVLAFVKVMLSHGHDPSKRLWVQCQDVDRAAALMCYLQLSLWHVPAVVIVGNTLALEVREAFYTPAHYLGFWGVRLRNHGRQEAEEGGHANGVIDVKVRDDVPRLEKASDLVTVARPVSMTGVPSIGALQQFDFGF